MSTGSSALVTFESSVSQTDGSSPEPGSGDVQVDLIEGCQSGGKDFAERVLTAGFWHPAC